MIPSGQMYVVGMGFGSACSSQGLENVWADDRSTVEQFRYPSQGSRFRQVKDKREGVTCIERRDVSGGLYRVG